MQIHCLLFLAALASICVRAQNITASTAIATPSDHGDPTKPSSYPICAQKCNNQTAAVANLIDYGCDIVEPGCGCQPLYRARIAACTTTSMTEVEFSELIIAIGQKIICSLQDYLKTETLSQEVCGSFYEKNSTLGSAVSSAIASATSAASAATMFKDPTNPADFPPCAQACFDKFIPASGCGSLANRTCICSTASLNYNLGHCEVATCSRTDVEKIAALANALCYTVGGQAIDSNRSANSDIASTSTPTSLPSPSPFTGQALGSMASGLALYMMIAVGLLGFMVLGL